MNLYESIKKNLKESYSIEEVKDLLEELIGECRDYPENSPGYIYHSAINYLKDVGQDKLAIYLENCYDRCDSSYIKNSSVIDDLRYVLSKLESIKESVKVGPLYRLGTEDYITGYNDIRLDEIGITLKDIELFKRVDTSESAPDKVNYLLYISMEWDGDKTISVPISYNISDNEYEQEINPPMLGIYDEDSDSEVYDTVDEVVRNLALKISQSGRMNESDSLSPTATPEEIDEYYSDVYYKKTQEATDPEEKFENACYTAASQWMSGVDEETDADFIKAMIVPIAKDAYNNPNKTDEDYFNKIVFELQNARGIKFNFNK